MRVLTANPGSSSVKLAVVDDSVDGGVERESITIDAASVPRAHTPLSELADRWAPLDRLDALVFTGGVAEHQPALLAELVDRLCLLDVAVDPVRARDSGDRVISPAGAPVPVLLITAREDLEMARQTRSLLTGRASGPLVTTKGSQ